ncbi:hypothetical protein BT96DRAFT_929296 [Gymnopus androsaceus JB14]|uniref:Uncharacterized protein n=1 Tax=Gymnopus androsaceus JB14 TaxID=1447944 RepID=A0A6A4GG30_9AGAR|nr:hypothetical protein BT96DRAFT_929296 [Gymnopus androsaceus JB14]
MSPIPKFQDPVRRRIVEKKSQNIRAPYPPNSSTSFKLLSYSQLRAPSHRIQVPQSSLKKSREQKH